MGLKKTDLVLEGRRARTLEMDLADSFESPSVSVLVDGGETGGLYDHLLSRAVRMVLSSEGVQAADMSVTLLVDESIQTLNREHLGHDYVTDVIAFPLWAPGEPVVGEICLGLEQARRQASEVGACVDEELVRLTVHGTLHVLGWEHPGADGEREGSAMWRRQEELVKMVLAGV